MLPEIITIRKATNLIGTLFQTKIGSTRDTCFLRHHFQCYREGQEDQLGALGLVTNSVVLWNSLYMQEALSHLRSTGETPEDKHIARLSPLMQGIST
jgi:Transposase and inactivated derivatives, TnpA family